jgi:hypothetical protein
MNDHIWQECQVPMRLSHQGLCATLMCPCYGAALPIPLKVSSAPR